MAERVDVLVAGTGFGGAIAAHRLAELYVAAGADPRAIVCLERGRRFGHTDFKQSMHVDHLSSVYQLVQGQGMQVVTANAVGGGSNLYLAASLRSPRETFERRDRHPDDGPDRRMWPGPVSRTSLDPYYARAEAALRVRRPTWDQVSKAGGVWAAALDAAGHTCDRVPLAINPDRCVDANWCHTGCIFGAKNSLITNYLGHAVQRGVQVRELRQVESVRQTQARPYRYVVTVSVVDPRTGRSAASEEIECKVLVLATGAMNDAPILMRSRLALPALSPQLGRHLGSNGDHLAAIELDPDRVRDVLGLPGYADLHKGKPITTMTYDFWPGRRDGERFTLQEIFLSPLTNLLYDDGRDPAGEPSWWGRQKKRAISSWSSRIEVLAMVEDTHDGQFLAPSPTGGGAIRPNGGPVAVGTFTYAMTERSRAVRARADEAIRAIASHRGLGRFMAMTETRGTYVAHPLGGCRMATGPDLGVTAHDGSVFGYEGLYCFGSSIIPTSLGVNPSLTIAAVAERCAEHLVARAADLGLPVPAGRLEPDTPREIVGPRVVPATGQPGYARKRAHRSPHRRRRLPRAQRRHPRRRPSRGG